MDDITAEIATVLTMQQGPLAPKMAYGIVASQFETDAIGPYFEAIDALPDADRERRLAMALEGWDTDGISSGWILGELNDLSDPVTRAAVVAYVACADPSSWFSPQSGMEGVVSALGLLTADGVPLPHPADGGNTDPAWRVSMTVIMGALADAAGRVADQQAVGTAWAGGGAAGRPRLRSTDTWEEQLRAIALGSSSAVDQMSRPDRGRGKKLVHTGAASRHAQRQARPCASERRTTSDGRWSRWTGRWTELSAYLRFRAVPSGEDPGAAHSSRSGLPARI